VTGRNAPSVINAVFNRDNFWDGRANHDFNRTDPFASTRNAASSTGPSYPFH
jgi:cytochrome c peroxidase